MAKRAAKTMTLMFDPDNPAMSVFPGHVTAKVFDAAYKAEGWRGDPVRRSDLTHGFLKKLKRSFKIVDKDSPGAMPFTIMHW